MVVAPADRDYPIISTCTPEGSRLKRSCAASVLLAHSVPTADLLETISRCSTQETSLRSLTLTCRRHGNQRAVSLRYTVSEGFLGVVAGRLAGDEDFPVTDRQRVKSAHEIQRAADDLVGVTTNERPAVFARFSTAIMKHFDHPYDSNEHPDLFSLELPLEIQRFAAVWLLRRTDDIPAIHYK